MLERTGAVLLKQGDVVEDQIMYHGGATWGTAFGPVEFEVYQGKKVRFFKGSEEKFAEAYADFRKSLFEERKRQRRQPWNP